MQLPRHPVPSTFTSSSPRSWANFSTYKQVSQLNRTVVGKTSWPGRKVRVTRQATIILNIVFQEDAAPKSTDMMEKTTSFDPCFLQVLCVQMWTSCFAVEHLVGCTQERGPAKKWDFCLQLRLSLSSSTFIESFIHLLFKVLWLSAVYLPGYQLNFQARVRSFLLPARRASIVLWTKATIEWCSDHQLVLFARKMLLFWGWLGKVPRLKTPERISCCEHAWAQLLFA